uniref:Transporter n=1 Tax=Plectus sambesii TaxID=2011161 RepID=A0A914XLC4_9BILA
MAKVTPAPLDLENVDAAHRPISNVNDFTTEEGGGSKEPEREQWGSTLDFILSCIGYAVGLGNILRFPYITGRNGGAAFLIPYVLMMTFAGFPVFYLELVIGQYSQVTPYLLYQRMCPLFNGLGLTMIMITFFTAIYYNISLAWSLRYMYAGIFESVPWSKCRPLNDSGNELCYDDKIGITCTYNCTINDPQSDLNATSYYDGACRTKYELQSLVDSGKVNDYRSFYCTALQNGSTLLTPAQEYNNYVLGYDPKGEIFASLGTPKWDLIVALAASWVMVFLVLIKGIKSSGKVVYFTATFPYVILIALLIIGNLQPGADRGITFYLSPKWEKLSTASIWADAASQIFFSLSVGGGGLTTLATYNKFNSNILRDTLIVVLGNCSTSLFAGFVIFPILGFISQIIGKTVEEVAASGPTLAFVSYPDALTRISGPAQLYAVLFFFMLIILGIDSQLVLVEVVITMVADRFTYFQKNARRRILAVIGVCIIMFCFGILLTTPQGPAIYNLLDTFAGGITLVIACLVELIMVMYVYGFKRFVADIHCMLGKPPSRLWVLLGYPTNIFWHACWIFITPVLLIAILGFQFSDSGDFTYQDKTYPTWAVVMGWCITGLCCVWIPLNAVVYFIRATIKKSGYRSLITPTQEWGPKDAKSRAHVGMALSSNQ